MSKSNKYYFCKYCNNKLYWNDHEVWSCSKCNNYFCIDCFKKITGKSIQSILETENVLCPDCISVKPQFCPFCGKKIESWESNILPNKLYGIVCIQCGKWIISKPAKGTFGESLY